MAVDAELYFNGISIHAPREGCDWRSQRLLLL